MLHGLDLFSGVAGNSIALSEWVKVIAYCESDAHAQAVLLSRMLSGNLEPAPICTDIRELDGSELKGLVDIIVGGFPCQDISVAGKGKGLAGERSGLFFEIMRLAKEIKPAFLFLENVPAIRTRGMDRVIGELSALGYDCRWTMLSASDVGAPHKRERWFLLGYSKHNGRERSKVSKVNGETPYKRGESREKKKREFEGTSCLSPNVAYTDCERLEIWESRQARKFSSTLRTDWWEFEPDVGRVVNGLPYRVDRIKRLGNAVVPLQAREAFRILMGIKNYDSQSGAVS